MSGNKMMATAFLCSLAFLASGSVQADGTKKVTIKIAAVQALKAEPASNTLKGRLGKVLNRSPFPELYKQYSLLSEETFTRGIGEAATLKSKGNSTISVTPSMEGKTLMMAVKAKGGKGACALSTSYEAGTGAVFPIICDNLIPGGTVIFFVSGKEAAKPKK